MQKCPRMSSYNKQSRTDIFRKGKLIKQKFVRMPEARNISSY